MAGPWLFSKTQKCNQCKSLSACWAKGMEASSVWWHFHLVKSPAPGSPWWQSYVHSGEKQNKVGRDSNYWWLHTIKAGNLSICRTLSGNYTPSTGLLNSSLSASLQDVTRVQRANISFSDSRSHKNFRETATIMVTWLHREETGKEEHSVHYAEEILSRKTQGVETEGDKVYFWTQNCLYVSAFSQSTLFSILPDSIFILRKTLQWKPWSHMQNVNI